MPINRNRWINPISRFSGGNKISKIKAFTLIELMVVIVLVSILAAVSLSIMKGRVDAAKWAEAKAGAGTIAKAFVSYASEKRQNGTYPPTLTQLGFTYSDLHGTYFVFDDYSIPSASYTPGANPELTYIIQVDKPTLTPSRITLDNSGNWTESNP